MAMKNIGVAVLALAALAGLVVVIALVDKHGPPSAAPPRTGQGSEPPSVAAGTGYVKGEIVPLQDSGIPREFVRLSPKVWDANGLTVYLPPGYEKGMPLVEMSFLKREMDGTVKPFRLRTVGVFGSMGMHGAHTLLLGVVDDPNVSGELRPGMEYTVSHYVPAGENQSFRTPPLNPTFRVPENLPPNSVYRVDLIIEDEIARQ